MLFVYRNILGVAIGGACGGENEVANAVATHGFKHLESRKGVILIVLSRLQHRLTNIGIGGKVDDRLDGVGLEDVIEQCCIGHIAGDEGDVFRYRLLMSVDQVVEYHNLFALFHCIQNIVTTDVAGTSGYQNQNPFSFMVQSVKRYFIIVQMAISPSFQLTFLPSE